MDHVSVVVDDLPAAIAFFTTLGMALEGEMPVEGSWVDRLCGLEEGERSERVMMTLVVARRFGRGVVNRGLQPGQIKILPIAHRVTITYSGLVVPALDLIKSARTEVRAGASLTILSQI